MLDPKPLILVVDPEVDTLTSLYALLEKEGYRVATASTRLDVLKYVSHARPDLVLASTRSWDRPDLSLVGEIKEESFNTRVVVLAGREEWTRLGDSSDSQVDGILLEPLYPKDVLRSVSRALEQVPR